MAFITAAQVSTLAVELLARQVVLPATVTRVGGGDYTGSGGTTKVRIPAARTAREQATPGAAITYDAIAESAVDVALDHWYNGVLLDDEALTLSIVDFGRQVLAPMVKAVAEAGENILGAVMDAVTPSAIEFAATPAEADTKAVVLAARQALTEANVDSDGRFLVVSPGIATRFLSVGEYVKANESGSADTLRRGVIGNLLGFTVVESNAIAADTALAFHRSAFAFATLAPAIPRGASSAGSATVDGISLRTVADYDPGHLSDAIVVSTFGGAAVIDANRVVGITVGS